MKYVLFVLSVVVLASCGQGESPVENMLAEAGSDLKPGQLTERKKLSQHVADTFRLDLSAPAFVYGYAEQLTVDVIVKVISPGNREIEQFDSPARGPEFYKFIADTAGVYKILVEPFEHQSGEYSMMLTSAERKASTPEGVIEQQVRAALGTGNDTPGVAIAVQRDGKLIYSKGFGNADIEQHAKVTPTTVFHVASVSKQFTAYAIATLADEGKININDDIRKYLPEMHDFGTPITINHLVHHTSGLRDQWNLLTMAGWRMDDVITLPQIMRIMSKQRELNFQPGDEHLYCNSGFTLMAEIVHRVSGEPFPEWCRKNIFDPLGMKNTLFYDDHERIVMNRAYSYDRAANGYKKRVLSYANAGATSLFTTVEDLSLWARNFEQMTVGNKNIMDMMNQRFVLNNGDTIAYAFGQVIQKYKGLNTYGHGGADAGFRTYLLRFPDQHFSVSVLSNSGSFPVGTLAYELADAYLQDEFKPDPPKKEDAPPPPPARSSDEVFDPLAVKLDEYAGKFYSPELETVYTLEVKNDTLVAHHQRHDDMKLTPSRRDGFDVNILGNLMFYREKGKVAGFRASNGRVRNLKFVRQE